MIQYRLKTKKVVSSSSSSSIIAKVANEAGPSCEQVKTDNEPTGPTASMGAITHPAKIQL